MLKTYKKYCNFDIFPYHFIVTFKRLWTCDRCMAHMQWLCRVVAARIEFVLFINIQSLGMKLSMKNKFPNHLLFPEISIFLEITASKTLFIVLLFTLGTAHEYRTQKKNSSTLLRIHMSKIFSDLSKQKCCLLSSGVSTESQKRTSVLQLRQGF